MKLLMTVVQVTAATADRGVKRLLVLSVHVLRPKCGPASMTLAMGTCRPRYRYLAAPLPGLSSQKSNEFNLYIRW
jgi:hypothetical protein